MQHRILTIKIKAQIRNLYEIPALMEAALHFFTVEKLRESAFHIIHEAAGVGQECRGAKSTQMKKSFFGVAGKLEEEEGDSS